MITSKELITLKTTDLYQLNLDELLESLDRLLQEVDPLTFASLNPGATNEELKRLETAAHCTDGLHPDLVTLYRWHNGQDRDTYRYLSLEAGWQKFATIDEAIQVFKVFRRPDNPFENWSPITVCFNEDTLAFYGTGIFCNGESAGVLKNHNDPNGQPYFKGLKHYIIAIINYTIDRSTLPIPEQYWVMGVAAPSIELNRNDSSMIGGTYTLSKDGTEIEMLRSYWKITTEEGLSMIISGLMSRQDYPDDPTQGSLAWDLCRASYLASSGRMIGWLSKEKSWELQLNCAKRIQSHYASWKEMANDFYYSKSRQMEGVDGFLSERGLERLFKFSHSPFQLPWNTELDTVSPPDLLIEERTLSPEENELLNELVSIPHIRPVTIQLLPGTYTIYKTITRGVKISGAKEGGTIIMGAMGQDALTLKYCGAVLEDLTIMAQENPEQPNEDITGIYSFEKCYIRLHRISVASPQLGIVAHGAGQIDMHGCTIHAEGRHGLEISSGQAHVHDCTISGNSYGVLLLEKSTAAWFMNTTIHGSKRGIEINSSFANLEKCTVTGQTKSAVQLFKGGEINAYACNFVSQESTVINTPNPKEGMDFDSRNSLIECELSSNNSESHSLSIKRDYFFSVKDCKIYNTSSCKGGFLTYTNCTIENTVFAYDQGVVYFFETTVNSAGKYSLNAYGNASVRAANSRFDAGVSAKEESVVYLHNCLCKGTNQTYAATAETKANLWLSYCTLETASEVRVIGVNSDSRVIIVDSQITSNNGCTFYVNGGQARIWRSTIVNQHEQGFAFYNEGDGTLILYDTQVVSEYVGLKCTKAEAHFYRCKVKGNTVAVALEGVSPLLISDTCLTGNYSLSSELDVVIYCHNEQMNGITNIQQKEMLESEYKFWDGFSGKTSNSVTVNITDASPEVLHFFDQNRENHWEWWDLVRAAFQLASPATACKFNLQDEYFTIELQDWEESTFPDGLLQTIHELLNDAVEAEQAIHMVHALDWSKYQESEKE